MRLALVAIGVLVCTVVAYAATSAPSVVENQRERAATLGLVGGNKSSPLLAIDLTENEDRRWDGFSVSRILVAQRDGSQGAKPLAGTEQLPGPGEVLVSPRLEELMSQNETIEKLMSAYTVVGSIGGSGLAQPRELRAVIGVAADTTGLEPVSGQGLAVEALSPTQRALTLGLGLLLFVVVAIPTLALVVMSARLGSRQRRTRIDALRRIGLSRARTRGVMAVETAVVALPATALGMVFFAVGRRIDRIPLTDVSFDGAAASPPFWLALLLPLLVTAGAMAAASAGIGVVDDTRQVGAASTLPTSSRAGFVVLAAAAASLAVLPWVPAGASKALMLWTSLGVAGVGLLMSASGLVIAASRLLAHLARTAGTLVGHRVNTREPGTTTRLAGVVAVVLVGVAGAGGFLSILQGGTNAREAASGSITISVSDYASALTLEGLRNVNGVMGVAPVVDLNGNRDTVLAMVVDCDKLATVVGNASGCADEVQWTGNLANGRASVLSKSQTVQVAGQNVALPLRRSAVDLSGGGAVFDGLLKVPSRFFPDGAPAARRYILTLPGELRSAVIAAISSQAPTAGFNFGDDTAADTDSAAYATEVSLLLVGSTVGIAVAVLALAVSAAGEAGSRRHRLRGLTVIGASRRERTRTHVASTFTPMALLALVATLIAWACNAAMHALDERAGISAGAYAVMVGGSAAAALLITAVTLPSALGRDAE